MPFSTGMERIVTLSNAREGTFAPYWESLSRKNLGVFNLVNRLLSTIPSKRPTAAEVVDCCEILKCEILNTLTESKRNELEAENRRLKALVARYSGDYNDDGTDVSTTPTPNLSASPRVITRNSPINIIPPQNVTADPNMLSAGVAIDTQQDPGTKHLQRLNTM